MLNIRRAKLHEAAILTDIAIRSEAYWGYDADYMDKFERIYKVTEAFIGNNPTFVILEDESITRFYGISITGKEISLEYLFIEPKSIGKGYGKLLWEHMVAECENLGIKKLAIVTSPQAKEFYIKMGAVPFGEVESFLKEGRIIPKLMYVIEKK